MLSKASAAERGNAPLALLTVTTLYPNSIQKTHGLFVETRLRKLLETGQVKARVLAPVPWLPFDIEHPTLGRISRVPRQALCNGIEVHHPRYLVVPKIGMTLTPHTLYRTLRRSFAAMIKSGEPVDLIDAHYFYPDGVAAVWLAQEFNLPVVVTARGTDVNLIPEYATPRRLILDAARKADGIVAVCDALKQRLVDLGVAPAHITVLRNGVDLRRFHPMDRVSLRREFGLERLTLGSVGHLVERKGHHHVIRALAQLPDAELLIAGDGPERRNLEELVSALALKHRVRFLGALDQSELCRIYNALDILVLASSREGWANVLLEAMACGTPVVASNVWGTPEVVAAPEAGVLMPSLDPVGIVAGVTQLLAQPPQREATRRYAEGFDWDATTQGQLSLFRRILARRVKPQLQAAS